MSRRVRLPRCSLLLCDARLGAFVPSLCLPSISRAVDDITDLRHAVAQLLVPGIAWDGQIIGDAADSLDEAGALGGRELVQHTERQLSPGRRGGEVADVAHLGQTGGCVSVKFVGGAHEMGREQSVQRLGEQKHPARAITRLPFRHRRLAAKSV
eukprot:scaffold6174_cov125-Isochrysis_galbana.AAC.10